MRLGPVDSTDERAVYAVTLVALLVASGVVGVVGAVGAAGGSGTAARESTPADADAYRVTDDGVRYTVHPSELRQGCAAGRDCIPSIDDPNFQSAGSAGWLAPSDLVIGVEIDGEARAYPLRILNVHEIVNDRVAGRPIAVTYCPLCRSGLVFSRAVGDATLEFGVSGKLLDANLVMYDRRTGTYWSQIRGEAVVGPMVPRTLDQHPSTITSWGQWREAHPDTRVLSRDTGIYPASTYGSDPYARYADSPSVGPGVEHDDERLPAKELVYGVAVGNASRAYPADTVADRDAINDEVGGIPVLLVEEPTTGDVRVFLREVNGTTPSFRVRDGRLLDERGHRWSFEGEALAGPNEGARLDRLESHGLYWFAWRAFHPETAVYFAEPTG